jgi:hypothetical protein
MNSMRDLIIHIQELLDRGHSHNWFAKILEIPVNRVSEARQAAQEFDDYAQENDYFDDY